MEVQNTTAVQNIAAIKAVKGGWRKPELSNTTQIVEYLCLCV
jgi:hypothetical protein